LIQLLNFFVGNETSLKEVFTQNQELWTNIYKDYAPSKGGPPGFSVYRKNFENSVEFQGKTIHVLLLKCRGKKFKRNANAHIVELHCETYFYGPLVVCINHDEPPYALDSLYPIELQILNSVNKKAHKNYPPGSQKGSKSEHQTVSPTLSPQLLTISNPSYMKEVSEKIGNLESSKKKLDPILFYMYRFKTVMCPKINTKHDWSHCIYAHRTQDFRRPADLYYYLPHDCPHTCPDNQTHFHEGCPDGKSCKFCHSKLERLYHPHRYKTSPCECLKSKNKTCKRGDHCAFYHSQKEKKKANKIRKKRNLLSNEDTTTPSDIIRSILAEAEDISSIFSASSEGGTEQQHQFNLSLSCKSASPKEGNLLVSQRSFQFTSTPKTNTSDISFTYSDASQGEQPKQKTQAQGQIKETPSFNFIDSNNTFLPFPAHPGVAHTQAFPQPHPEPQTRHRWTFHNFNQLKPFIPSNTNTNTNTHNQQINNPNTNYPSQTHTNNTYVIHPTHTQLNQSATPFSPPSKGKVRHASAYEKKPATLSSLVTAFTANKGLPYFTQMAFMKNNKEESAPLTENGGTPEKHDKSSNILDFMKLHGNIIKEIDTPASSYASNITSYNSYCLNILQNDAEMNLNNSQQQK
jgi:hypothetical protein